MSIRPEQIINARVGDALHDPQGNFHVIQAVIFLPDGSINLIVSLYDKPYQIIYKDSLFFDESMKLIDRLNHSRANFNYRVMVY